MKIWKLIGTFLSALWLSACTTEEIINTPDTSEGATTLIAVSMDDLLPVNMNSRAGSINSLLSEMKDLNIRVHKNGGGYTSIYCKGGNIFVDGKGVNSTKAYYIDGSNWNEQVKVHCNDIQAKFVSEVEVIANWGSDLYETNDWSTLKEEGDGKLQEGYCVMYGKTQTGQDNKHDNSTGALDCRRFEVKLNRTRAMLSVKIDGAELREGVTITPTKVMLKNVPTSCLVTQDNKISNNDGKDVEYSLSDLGWNGSITKGGSIGVHADSGESGMPDNFRPMYLFENKQGVTSNNDQVKKWPQNCNNVEDAKANKTHSYIEIEADYKYEAGGQLKNSGTIVYRFFLGGNIINDFNVNKNTYYRLTLALKNFGGAKEDGNVDGSGNLVVNEEDVSWRVDLNVRDWGFEKDAYDFDAHAVVEEIAVIGSGWTLESISVPPGQSWLRFKSDDYGTVGWAEPTDNNIQGNNGKIIFYIQPMQSWEFETINEKRTITLTIKKGNDRQTITISQWTPINIGNNIWMERFEEDNCLQTWGFNDVDVANKIINFESLGNKRKYITGEDVKTEQELGNTHYGYQQVKDAAHAYCYQKGGKDIEGNPPGGDAEPYALPDKATFQMMLDYSRKYPEGKFDPIIEHADYWTSSVLSGKGQETMFWNSQEQSYTTTTQRTEKKG